MSISKEKYFYCCFILGFMLDYSPLFLNYQGRIQDFLKGGSESGVDIDGGANPSIVSLKQGVWGARPPRSYGVFNFG